MDIPVLALELLAVAPAPGPVFDNPDLSGTIPFFASPLATLRNWAAEILVELSIAGVVVVMIMLIVGQITGRAWPNAIAGLVGIVVAVVVGLNPGTFLSYFAAQETTAASAAAWTDTPAPTA